MSKGGGGLRGMKAAPSLRFLYVSMVSLLVTLSYISASPLDCLFAVYYGSLLYITHGLMFQTLGLPYYHVRLL